MTALQSFVIITIQCKNFIWELTELLKEQSYFIFLFNILQTAIKKKIQWGAFYFSQCVILTIFSRIMQVSDIPSFLSKNIFAQKNWNDRGWTIGS